MHRNRLNALLIVVLMLAAVPLLPAAPARAAETVTVGLSVPSLEDPFYAGMTNGAQAAADELTVDLVVTSAEGDIATELANVQELLDTGIDALVISPVDMDASRAAIALANDAAVPVVLAGAHVSAALLDAEVAVTVAADEVQGGQLAGSVLCSALDGAGTVVALLGAADDAVAQQRSEGLTSYVADECTGLDVVPFESADMDRDAFIEAFSALLREQDIAGVLAINEALTLPAIESTIITRQSGIAVVSFDASDDALAALNQGRLRAIVLPVGWWIGGAGVEASVSLASGEAVDSTILIDLGVLDIETVVRGPGGRTPFGKDDPRAGFPGSLGGDGELEGGDGELEGGDGELEGGDGELEGGDGELEGGDGELEGGDGELEGGDGELEGGDGELE